MKKILCYTRKPIDEYYYDPRLAYSMHIAIAADKEGKYIPLNHNSGILFAKATENEDGSLNPKCIKHPYVFHIDKGEGHDAGFGVVTIITGADGEIDEETKGCVAVYTSRDLLEYEEPVMIRVSDDYIERAVCKYDRQTDSYNITWLQNGHWYNDGKEVEKPDDLADFDNYSTDIEGCVPECVTDISDDVADRLISKIGLRKHVATIFPESLSVSSKEALYNMSAIAVYNDGTTAVKRIDWDKDIIEKNEANGFDKPFNVTGKLHKDTFTFPLIEHRADPCITYWKGSYYFIATTDSDNPEDNNHTIYVRKADSIPELFNAEEKLILDSETYSYVGNLLWAPEFHEIDGKLYIFLALTHGPFFYEESHIIELREGGDPSVREDWSAPKRIVKADGTDICEAGKTITLDMTCFLWQGEYYVVWSQRQFLPKDLGAWLYIAKLNRKEPWKLASEPVVISKPDYGWANNHTFVDEGPFAIVTEDRLFLTFSSAAVDTSYVVGLLTLNKGDNPLLKESWKKTGYPLLTSRSEKGQFGTGHNAYVTDAYGDIWNTYHARPGIDGPRSTGIRRVHFDIDGIPVLDLTEENDVSDENSTINVQVTIKK